VDFIERVEKYLHKEKHTIKPVKAISSAGGSSLYPDLFAEKDGQTCYI